MTVKFIHVRVPRDPEGDPNGQVDVKGGTTIAYDVQKSEDEQTLVVTYIAARCHYRDNYSRKIGAAIASGRLKSSKHQNYTLKINSGDKVVESILRDYWKVESQTLGGLSA